MSNHWSEHGDILVHENRGSSMAGCVLVLTGTVMIPFIAAGWVAVTAWLMLWTAFGVNAMSNIVRVEFDRRSGSVRQRNALGLKWTDRLEGFASVQVVRATSARGYPQIRVNLKRADARGRLESCYYLVAIYGLVGDAEKNEARQWGDRLARFLHLPLHVDL